MFKRKTTEANKVRNREREILDFQLKFNSTQHINYYSLLSIKKRGDYHQQPNKQSIKL